MGRKLTNEDLDKRLEGRGIKRIGDYVDVITPINFICQLESCCHVWQDLPARLIYSKKKCPKCVEPLVNLTNELIDKRLENSSVIRLGDIINSTTRSKFKCLDCGSIMNKTPGEVCNGSSVKGCGACYGNLLFTNELIDKKLIGKNIKRISNYVNIRTSIWWGCLVEGCEHSWLTNPKFILDDISGCPKCAGNIKYTNEDIDKMLIGRFIRRLDDYDGMAQSINWFCEKKDCNHSWKNTPRAIIHSIRGCPMCKKKNEKAVYDFLTKNGIKFETQKNLKTIASKNKAYLLDFYLSDFNTVIEYNGRQHYEMVCFGGMDKERARQNLKKQINRDQFVKYLLFAYDIDLIVIDGRKYSLAKNNLQEYLVEMLEKIKGKNNE